MKTEDVVKGRFNAILADFCVNLAEQTLKEMNGEEMTEEEVEARATGIVDQLMNVTKVYYEAPEGLVEMRGHLGKCAFDMDPEKPLIEVKITLAKNMDNLMALARIGNSVTIRGLQLDLEKSGSKQKPAEDAEHPGQTDLEQFAAEQEAGEAVQRVYRNEDGDVYRVAERSDSDGEDGGEVVKWFVIELVSSEEGAIPKVFNGQTFDAAPAAQRDLDEYAASAGLVEVTEEPTPPVEFTEPEPEPEPVATTEAAPEPEPKHDCEACRHTEKGINDKPCKTCAVVNGDGPGCTDNWEAAPNDEPEPVPEKPKRRRK